MIGQKIKNMNKLFFRSSFILLSAALLVASGFFIADTALANTHTTSVNVSPQFIKSGAINIYTFSITNNGTDSIYLITINIPADSSFSTDINTISCPSGWTKDISSNSLKAVCITATAELNSGSSISISFEAISPTPTQDTQYSWVVVTRDLVEGGSEFTNTDAKTTIDVTPPATTDNTLPAVWSNTDITVTLICYDGAGSGCDKTYYTTDGSDPTTSSSQGNVITLTNSRIYTIKYFF